MNIKGLNKAEVLLALWKGSKEQGISFLGREDVTLEDCGLEIESCVKFNARVDYFGGRVIKVNFNKDVLDLWLYNRDNGEGAGERIIEQLKKKDKE